MKRRAFLQAGLSLTALTLTRVAVLAEPVVLGRERISVPDPERGKTLAVDVWYPAEPGSPSAPVPDSIWVRPPEARGAPVKKGRFPLIMLSHGFHGNPETLIWLIEALVGAGYIVAGPTHDDPNLKNVHMNHWNRALDVSKSLTALLDSPLGKSVSPDRIGMVGYSLGGGTGVWLAGGLATEFRRTANPGPDYAPALEFPPVGSRDYEFLLTHTDFAAAARSYRDPRIRAFFLLAPSLGWAFSPESLEAIDVPLRVTLGSADEMLVPRTNGLYYASHVPGAKAEVVPGAGHYVFLSVVRPESLAQDLQLAEIAVDPPGVVRNEVHKKVAQEAVNFFDAALREHGLDFSSPGIDAQAGSR